MIYLLHFTRKIGDPDNPRGQAQHYIGWVARAEDLEARLQEHRAGNGARIMAHVARLGISFVVALTLAGDRAEERRLKNRKDAPDWCPVCQNSQEE